MDAETTSQSALALREELRRAITAFERDVERFKDLRRQALTGAGGGAYDADTFDRSVVAVRDAVARVRAARGRFSQALREGAPPLTAPGDRPNDEARLRFVRWLVDTGRLSDHIPDSQAGAAA